MDGFAGFKTAATWCLTRRGHGTRSRRCFGRRRSWTAADNGSGTRPRRRRDRTGDPCYGIRRARRTGVDLLTDGQRQRIGAVFADSRRFGGATIGQ